MRELFAELIGKNERMRNVCVAFAFGLTVLGCFTSGRMVSYANSPAPANSFSIFSVNLPQETTRLELLIPIPEEDAAYLPYNEEFEKLTGAGRDSEIAGYRDEEGYVSYCAHMTGASCKAWEQDLGNGRTEQVFDFGVNAMENGQTHLQYIQKNFGSIKVAELDQQGNVLRTSDKVDIVPKRRKGYLTSGLHYDGFTGELKAYIFDHYSVFEILGAMLAELAWLLFRPFGLVFHVLLTVAVECAVAYFFGIRRLLKVAAINVYSNLAFNLLMQSTVGSYLARLTFLELVVVMEEYCIYRSVMTQYGKKRLLAFTVTANGVSMVCGLLLGIT